MKMTKDELERAARLGRSGVCIDASTLDQHPGIVRKVTILRDLSLMIEFNTYGYDEGGPTYIAEYPDLQTMILALESYLKRPLTDWHNYTASGSYPAAPDGGTAATSDDDLRRFAHAVANGQLPLPEGEFRLMEPYWNEL